MNTLQGIIKYLKEILEKQPNYLIFFFAAFVLLVVSMDNSYETYFFDKIWIFFIYSVAGMVWRHLEKDIRNNVLISKKIDTDNEYENNPDNKKSKKTLNIIQKCSLVIYQIGNILLLYFLLQALGLIKFYEFIR